MRAGPAFWYVQISPKWGGYSLPAQETLLFLLATLALAPLLPNVSGRIQPRPKKNLEQINSTKIATNIKIFLVPGMLQKGLKKSEYFLGNNPCCSLLLFESPTI